jgi:hypothetical protein
MMRLSILLLTVLFVLVACAPATPAPQSEGSIRVSGVSTSLPTPITLEGHVDIVYPMSGSIIYSETLYLQGTAEELPEAGFLLQVIAPDDSVLAQSVIQSENGQWSVELAHTYTGDPTEVNIIAKSTDTTILGDYDIASIVIADVETRPEGVFGSVIVPSEGDTVGGDSIFVSGRGSGFFENSFVLVLETADDGEDISTAIVTMHNPYFVDDMIWEAELARNDFVGNAVIRAYYTDAESGAEVEIFRMSVVVSSVAG